LVRIHLLRALAELVLLQLQDLKLKLGVPRTQLREERLHHPQRLVHAAVGEHLPQMLGDALDVRRAGHDLV
jgi:hypothetical protein